MGIFSVLKHKDKKEKTDQKDQKVLDSKKAKDSKEEKKKELTVAEIAEDKDEKGKTKSKKSKGKANKHDTKDAYKVLLRALITEKASYLKAENKYLFEVNPDTNKNEIKKAIFHVYGVWPTKINVSNLGGKNKRYGRNTGVTKAKKKAIVTLKKGDTIELYEGV
jgi:large subunit ribosomal protein L23